MQRDTDDSLNAPSLMLGESPEASQDVAEFGSDLRDTGKGSQLGGMAWVPAWRIIPVSKWLITMVIVSPVRIGLFPFQMAELHAL